MQKLKSYSFYILTLVLLNACSVQMSRTPSPTEQAAILRVTEAYLRNIVLGRENDIEGMVIWADYLTAQSPPSTHQEYAQQLKSFKNYFTNENNPLLGLDLVEPISVRGDQAMVALRKAADKNAPVITLQLLWVGKGWLIQRDNIFGQKGLIAKLIPTDALEKTAN